MSAGPRLTTLPVRSVPLDAAAAEAELDAVRVHLLAEPSTRLRVEIEQILAERLVPGLLARGLLRSAGDETALARLLAHAFRIVLAFSDRPWTTQAEMLAATGLRPPDLLTLNAVIRESPSLQSVILDGGLGRKYWGTLLPLMRSGALAAALDDTPRWPARIGVYPGVSCMFYCGFCGRNPDAAYPGSRIAAGNRIFAEIFATAASRSNASFSFSGGLEPLTNPGIGQLVRDAAENGIRVPLITNGFMLTPRFLARHRGLWHLDSLRVSLYGVDEGSYYAVTRKPGAFAQVKKNLVEFLRLRNERNQRLRVGLNFIVLPSTIDQLLPLATLIAEIGDAVGNGHSVDFLTLREDFSVPEEQSLPAQKRQRLIEIFAEFERRMAARCGGIDIDFGYALWALKLGVLGRPLAMARHTGMRPRAFAQVSVVVDLLGDVYLYREAGFLRRPGAERYCIGRVERSTPLETVIARFLAEAPPVVPLPGDPVFMDAFDHVVTLMVNRMEADRALGVGLEEGPVRLP